MEIKLEKLKELPDAKHPNNIEVGFIKTGNFVAEPEVGKAFYIGWNWRTSLVTEIIDANTFRTLNSIYVWSAL